MPRRVSLPGADELFRTTGGAALQAPQPRQRPGGEGQQAAQGDTRLRPVSGEGAGQDREDRQDPGPEGEAEPRSGAERSGARPEGDGAEHGGRDVPPGRRPLNGSGVPTAAAAGPGTTATVTPPVPPVATAPQVPAQGQNPVPPPITTTPQAQAAARRKAQRQNRRPSGRERHDEKITVYVSAEELMDLEHARLVLRGEHGLAIDRGRIVREAVAVVLADLESRGDASILVRRLRGR